NVDGISKRFAVSKTEIRKKIKEGTIQKFLETRARALVKEQNDIVKDVYNILSHPVRTLKDVQSLENRIADAQKNAEKISHPLMRKNHLQFLRATRQFTQIVQQTYAVQPSEKIFPVLHKSIQKIAAKYNKNHIWSAQGKTLLVKPEELEQIREKAREHM